MSLLTYASPWTNEDKKKTPSVRKSLKHSPVSNSSTNQEYTSTDSAPTSNSMPLTINEVQNIQEERGNKVHELLSKMTEVDAENDGAHLVNFSPITPPTLTRNNLDMIDDAEDIQKINPVMQPKNRPNGVYLADNRSLANLTNYQNSYTNQPLFQNQNKPYYANMGVSSQGSDSKLMERINYMIHLLEQQQHEKTANITEEFLLYSFLGVFVIYVVDSFTKNGKYVR